MREDIIKILEDVEDNINLWGILLSESDRIFEKKINVIQHVEDK